LWEPTPWAIGPYAEGEMVNGTITPEDVAAAIAVCTSAADSSTYSLSNGQSLDLTTVLKDMSYNGIVKGLEQVDMATDTSAQLLIDQHMLQSHQTS
jgi:hypothetical protein